MRPRPGRRRLRFDRIDDVLAEVERLATAEAARGGAYPPSASGISPGDTPAPGA